MLTSINRVFLPDSSSSRIFSFDGKMVGMARYLPWLRTSSRSQRIFRNNIAIVKFLPDVYCPGNIPLGGMILTISESLLY